MAFGFFRRNQKFVLIVMAILMLTFGVSSLITSQMDCAKQPGEMVVGSMGDTEIITGDLNQADRDLRVLEGLGVGRVPGVAYDNLFIMLPQGDERDGRYLAYALLLAEARANNVEATESDARNAIARLAANQGLKDPNELYDTIRQRMNATPKTAVASMQNWLTIGRNFDLHASRVPPSQVELEHLYKDLNEKIDLRVVKLDAMDHAPAQDPSRAQIEDLFKKYAAFNPGGVDPEQNPFGFGYRQPNKVQVQYLLVKQDVVNRVARPSSREIQQYWSKNNQEFKAKGMNFFQAQDEIIARLSAEVAQRLGEQVLDRADALAAQQKLPAQANVYNEVAEQMIKPAGNILNRPLKNVRLEGTLKSVVEQLAREAKLNAICFPWGMQGDVVIDPNINVVVDEKDTTLGAALQNLADYAFGVAEAPSTQPETSPATTKSATAAATTTATKPAKSPALEWVTCEGFEGVIFPVGQDVEMLPVQAGQTALLDGVALTGDPVLGRAMTDVQGTGKALPQLAMSAKPFAQDPSKAPDGLTVGESGPRMFVINFGPGGLSLDRMLWRISQARKSYVPQVSELAGDLALRDRVIQDWKTREGYSRAVEKAKQIQQQAGRIGLANVAKNLGLKTEDTGLFARKVQLSPREEFVSQMYQRASQQRLEPAEQMMFLQQVMSQARLIAPWEVYWNNVQHLEIPRGLDPLRPKVIEAAFTLAPKNVTPPYKDGYRTTTCELQAMRQVVVMERIGFYPVVVTELRSPQGLSQLAKQVAETRDFQTQQAWCSLDNIKARVKFEEARR